MNNITNLKLSTISYKVLENNQHKKRTVEIDLANKNYSKKLTFSFLSKSWMITKGFAFLTNKRERERESKNLPVDNRQLFFYLIFDVWWWKLN